MGTERVQPTDLAIPDELDLPFHLLSPGTGLAPAPQVNSTTSQGAGTKEQIKASRLDSWQLGQKTGHHQTAKKPIEVRDVVWNVCLGVGFHPQKALTLSQSFWNVTIRNPSSVHSLSL
ncbi:UNVERIFIED_CONTAM: hypothetical protein K2H54_008130 [Gekko kuhli]